LLSLNEPPPVERPALAPVAPPPACRRVAAAAARAPCGVAAAAARAPCGVAAAAAYPPRGVAATAARAAALGRNAAGLRRRRARGAPFGLVALLAVGCGYQPLRSFPVAPGELFVTSGGAQVPDITLSADAVYGAQLALAREAQLGKGPYPRLEVEVVRVDERSSGVRAFEGRPSARGVSLGLLGRARVLDAPGAAPRFDTGDVRVAADVAAEADPRVDTLRRDDALRALARRLGETLVGRVLGLPTPLDERL
jgi:hypothetical protein